MFCNFKKKIKKKIKKKLKIKKLKNKKIKKIKKKFKLKIFFNSFKMYGCCNLVKTVFSVLTCENIFSLISFSLGILFKAK